MSAATPLEALFETIRKGIETGRVVIEIRAATEQTSLPVDEEAVVIARSILSAEPAEQAVKSKSKGKGRKRHG